MTSVDIADLRLDSRRQFVNRIDPIYILLDRLIFEPLFRPPKRSIPGEFEQLTAADIDFLIENLKKHRRVLWLNLALVVYLAFYGLNAILKHGDPAVVVTGLLAPAMITGGAWYAVSFGGIPEKFINSAFVLTFCMFLSFTLSMTLLVALLCKLTPWPIGIFFLVPAYAGLYIASILYDNLDGLKIGLDTALLKFSRAALNYYQKYGYVTRRETETDAFEDTSLAANSDEISLFTHYMTMLENNLTQLDSERTLQVANHLIASSTEILFNVVDLALHGSKIDRGEGFAEYVKNALDSDQDVVDTQTIHYLGLAIDALKIAMGPASLGELMDARSTLAEFGAMQDRAKKKIGEENSEAQQKFADHLFSQVFQKLLSLMNAHKFALFQRRSRRTGIDANV